jgi:hypothetical protein
MNPNLSSDSKRQHLTTAEDIALEEIKFQRQKENHKFWSKQSLTILVGLFIMTPMLIGLVKRPFEDGVLNAGQASLIILGYIAGERASNEEAEKRK